MALARKMVSALVIAVAACGVGYANQIAQSQHEQRIFTEDGPIQHTVPISADVLKVLMETNAAKEGMSFAQPSQTRDAAKLFRAGEVHLGRSDEVDLVVVGLGLMSGADNGWFWIVRSIPRNPQVVLFAGGNSLELMSTSTGGYRDIRSAFSTASETRNTVYHFDGNQYQKYSEKWAKNPR